jgi:hypothetical protein
VMSGTCSLRSSQGRRATGSPTPGASKRSIKSMAWTNSETSNAVRREIVARRRRRRQRDFFLERRRDPGSGRARTVNRGLPGGHSDGPGSGPLRGRSADIIGAWQRCRAAMSTPTLGAGGETVHGHAGAPSMWPPCVALRCTTIAAAIARATPAVAPGQART